MKLPDHLFILPFDHRSYFLKKIGVIDRDPTSEETELVKTLKEIIYQGFQKSLTLGIPKESAGILVDDVYGSQILIDAKIKHLITIQTTEISGKDYFAFEHGDAAEEYLTKINPDYAKALVRFDPRANTSDETMSLKNLKILDDICKKNNIGFLIEPLIVPTEANMIEYVDKHVFDEKLRPELMIELIKRMHEAEITPDIWKIEGFANSENYQKISDYLTTINPDARIIILGRGESDEYVEKWINAGKTITNVIGFAVGRTIFDGALDQYRSNRIDKDTASDIIAKNYYHYYQLFIN